MSSSYVNAAKIYPESKIFKTDAGELEGGSVWGGHNFINIQALIGHNPALIVGENKTNVSFNIISSGDQSNSNYGDVVPIRSGSTPTSSEICNTTPQLRQFHMLVYSGLYLLLIWVPSTTKGVSITLSITLIKKKLRAYLLHC